MDALKELFGNISVSQVITFGAAISAIVVLGKNLYTKITNFHDFYQEKDELLKVVSEKVNQIAEQQVFLKEQVKDLKLHQEEIDNRTRKHTLNSRREKLNAMYHFHMEDTSWTEGERDAFLALYEDYKELGGNGYVENEIYPALMSLDVITFDKSDK